MVKPVHKNKSKNPPILSHEFIIQNHADIVSCFAMIFVIGLLIQATTPIASIFIALQHNVTQPGEIPLYAPGPRDGCAVFFYSLICIVIHAILQEYVLDKVSKKLHLSKSKLAVFSNSGQLVTFYFISVLWGLDIIVKEHLVPDVSMLWANYPAPMSFMMKLFFIVQLSYFVHELPEIYFQRCKREEYIPKIVSAIAKTVFVAIPYVLNFNRLLLCLIVFHHMSEVFNHTVLLIQTMDKDEKFSKVASLASNAVLIFSRLLSVLVSVLTLWYGMAMDGKETIDLETGNYNIAPVRLGLLGAICLVQAYLVFSFIGNQLSKLREGKTPQSAAKQSKGKKEKSKKEKKTKKESDLPEADQNTTTKNAKKLKAK